MKEFDAKMSKKNIIRIADLKATSHDIVQSFIDDYWKENEIGYDTIFSVYIIVDYNKYYVKGDYYSDGIRSKHVDKFEHYDGYTHHFCNHDAESIDNKVLMSLQLFKDFETGSARYVL